MLFVASQLSSKWASVKRVVEMDMANWHEHNRQSARWKAEVRVPNWQDVIYMGDVYIKRRGGQGTAVYEAKCTEFGVTPCSQV